MGTTGDALVITSYASAPARTITAGGVTYAYRELVNYPDSGHGGIFQFHDTFAPSPSSSSTADRTLRRRARTW